MTTHRLTTPSSPWQIGRIALRTAAPSTIFGPWELFLFPNLKKSLTEQKFESSEEVIAAMETYFGDLEKTYFSDGLKKSDSTAILTLTV